ncbi:MAG: 3-phosphoshikimate 1-carboxyvinyltransferase [Coriobacteriales bacterium]|nr:3-phosphoshikimate 1-carboxyvinyltransferase [Coriobacteriales bacterium]
MRYVARPASGPLRGRVLVPGDKSLSHRAVLFAAMAEGTSALTGVLDSADVRSTISAASSLGAEVEVTAAPDGTLDVTVTGWGAAGPVAPSAPIDCGNSGTTARLLLGVLAGWPITATLTGDESLSRRPMTRVTHPLETMGATFTTDGGTLPVTVHGGDLHPISYGSPVGSAQVKTAILLAGLRADGRTEVLEPAPSRDHTELLLPAFGVDVGIESERHAAWVDGPASLTAASVVVPRDPSSAAFFAVAASIVPGSEVVIPGVALNPTRTGFLRVLQRMGADAAVLHTATSGAEPVGTITVKASSLHGTVVRAEEVPSLVDEIPVLAVAAGLATGETRFEGVGELRVKESDRLAAIAEGLGALGVSVEAGEDTLVVRGLGKPGPAVLESLGDHRLAMTWAVAALAGSEPVEIERFEAVDVSYPAFADDLQRVLAGSDTAVE